MASSSNLELALKITADAKEATAALQETQAQIKGVDQAAGGATNSAQRYTQQMSALQNSSRQAAQQAKNTADALALMAQIDPTAGKLDKLDALEASLNKLHNAGAISADDFARMGEILEAQRSKIVGVGEAAAEGAVGMHAFSLNTSQARLELGRMLKDLSTGQYARLGQSSMTLANYTGVMGALFTATAGAIAGVTAELGTFIVAGAQAAIVQDKLNKALAETGNAAGLTFASFQQLAGEIAGSNEQMGKAQDVLLALAANGKIGQQSLLAMGQAAMDMSQVTGMSAEKAAQAVSQMFDGSVQSLMKANDQWHFLDATVLAHIESLKQVGDEEDANRIAAQAFHDAVAPRIDEMTNQVYGLAAAWQSVAGGISKFFKDTWADIKTTSSLAIGTADKQTQLYYQMGLQSQAASHGGANASGFQNLLFGWGTQYQESTAKIAELTKQINDAQAKAEAQANQQQLDSQGAAGVQFLNQTLKQYADRETQRKEKIAEIHQQANAAIKDALSKQDTALAAQLQQQEQQAIAEVNARFTPKAKKGPDLGHLQGNADVAAVQDSLVIIQNAYKNADAQLAALRKSDQISDQQYYDGLRTDLDTYVTDRVAALEKEKAAVLASATTKAQRIEADQKAAQIDSEITKTQQDAATKRIQIDADEKAALDKSRQAWEQLQRSFETPAEVRAEDAIAQIQKLNQMLANGVINAQQYHDALTQIGQKAVTGALPTYNGPGSAVSGAYGELQKNFRAEQALIAAYQAQKLALNQKFNDADEAQEQAHQAALTKLDQDYAAKRNIIEQSRQQLYLQFSDQFFGQLATLSSSNNRKIAAIGKAAAIAQTIVKTYQSATEAYSAMAGIPYIGPALGAAAAAAAIAAGLANVAQIRSQGTGSTGYSEGGYTGHGAKHQVAGIVHAGEVVWSQADVARAGGVNTVESMRLRGYADGGIVSPFANAPSPAELGFNAPSIPRVSMRAMAAMQPPAPVVQVKAVLAMNADEVAHHLINTPSGQKAVVVTVGNNPRAIQGRWSAG